MLSSKCVLCGKKKSRFINKQDTSRIFGNIVRGTASIFDQFYLKNLKAVVLICS